MEKIKEFVKLLEKDVFDRVELSECTFNLYMYLLENLNEIELEIDPTKDLLIRIRKVRSSFNHSLLEHVELLDIKNKIEFSNIATIVFVIETQIHYIVHLEKWKEALRSDTTLSLSDFEFTKKFSTVFLEQEFLRLPLSQIYEILEVDLPLLKFTENETDVLEDFTEQLFSRVSLLMNLNFPSNDLNMPEYCIAIKGEEDLFKSNFDCVADFRILFDNIFQKIDKYKKIFKTELVVEHAISEDVESLKEKIASVCSNFEKESFLEAFTEFVLGNKICTKTMRRLYHRKYPEVQQNDTRRVVKHFLGQEAIVDYTNFKDIRAFYTEKPKYCYEFGFLFLMKENFDKNPLDFIEKNPLHAEEYCLIESKSKRTRFKSFLEIAIDFLVFSKIEFI